mmetsp:Transcript_3616/g.15304  ORF Transcript_3616/g.15304 Transcript_3616/m.15304 type:complete len:292 (-) Transcript_3616:931-1806(-)
MSAPCSSASIAGTSPTRTFSGEKCMNRPRDGTPSTLSAPSSRIPGGIPRPCAGTARRYAESASRKSPTRKSPGSHDAKKCRRPSSPTSGYDSSSALLRSTERSKEASRCSFRCRIWCSSKREGSEAHSTPGDARAPRVDDGSPTPTPAAVPTPRAAVPTTPRPDMSSLPTPPATFPATLSPPGTPGGKTAGGLPNRDAAGRGECVAAPGFFSLSAAAAARSVSAALSSSPNSHHHASPSAVSPVNPPRSRSASPTLVMVWNARGDGRRFDPARCSSLRHFPSSRSTACASS